MTLIPFTNFSGTVYLVGYGLFWLTFFFGNAVRFGFFRSHKWRPFHHILYFFVILSVTVSLITASVSNLSLGGLFLVQLIILLLMTRFPAKSKGHIPYALFSLFSYSCLMVYIFTL
ncbi:MAG: hypothetical protein SFU91_08080 [Chloroherpetonaceae bacterium]|nr:hypothetical protein [Chloroherpetonaceae bacterium]